jgi:hypothetical protein
MRPIEPASLLQVTSTALRSPHRGKQRVQLCNVAVEHDAGISHAGGRIGDSCRTIETIGVIDFAQFERILVVAADERTGSGGVTSNATVQVVVQ